MSELAVETSELAVETSELAVETSELMSINSITKPFEWCCKVFKDFNSKKKV